MSRDVKYKYASLEDYLISNPLTVDAVMDDGGGATVAVKGREIRAAILFADIRAFTSRTKAMSSTETLMFANIFFTWITAEALRSSHGIVDKYIGDEIMIVFSEDFGSTDPVREAIVAAGRIGDFDPHSFCPRMGIAEGIVTVGYVGTPVKYNCSVFGRPVAVASRCAGVEIDEGFTASIVMPHEMWSQYVFEDVFPPRRYENPDGSIKEGRSCWQLLRPKETDMKNLGPMRVSIIGNTAFSIPDQNAETRVREALEVFARDGSYRPRFG